MRLHRSKAVIPSMIEGPGKIINICSMMSELGRETVSAYAAAKGGLKMLTKNIASEYGEYNIQCLTVSGLAILQHRRQRLCARSSRTAPDIPLTSSSLPRHRPGRWGEAEDLGGPAVFLASGHQFCQRALYCTWMAASWPTSASSQNNLRQLKSGGPDRIGPLPDGMGGETMGEMNFKNRGELVFRDPEAGDSGPAAKAGPDDK